MGFSSIKYVAKPFTQGFLNIANGNPLLGELGRVQRSKCLSALSRPFEQGRLSPGELIYPQPAGDFLLLVLESVGGFFLGHTSMSHDFSLWKPHISQTVYPSHRHPNSSRPVCQEHARKADPALQVADCFAPTGVVSVNQKIGAWSAPLTQTSIKV